MTGARIAVARVGDGLVVEVDGDERHVSTDGATAIDELFRSDDPAALAESWFDVGTTHDGSTDALAAPIGSQEVWACGVTYRRSRDARKEESERSGGDVFYDLVYEAERPELFLKATPHRVVGPDAGVRIRSDSTWDVPEPELTLAVGASGRVIGVTIGNDMSSRSIEGENPLYLPQAKVYDACAALGPRIVLGAPPGADTAITLRIERDGSEVVAGDTSVGQIKRSFDELVEHLLRDNPLPFGAFLMTGTGIVPDESFTLQPGDVVHIGIAGIGTLTNHVVRDA